MTRQHKQPPMTVRNPAYRLAIQRLDKAMASANKHNDAYLSWVENEKLTRMRIALFGCAPK
jgi:hypothetical protein